MKTDKPGFMDSFSKNFERYIREYSIENVLYEEGYKFLQRGWLERDEFLKICLWKSRRSKVLLRKNKEERVRSITRKAFAEPDEAMKIKTLQKLSGVGLPMASAILSVTDPQKYPVIDIRTMQALKKMSLIEYKTITINSWLKYLDVIEELKKKFKKSAREIDKALFAYHRLQLDKDFKNLYS